MEQAFEEATTNFSGKKLKEGKNRYAVSLVYDALMRGLSVI